MLNADECFSTIYATLSSVFRHVIPYTADIPSFGSNWAFNLAFDADTAVLADLPEAARALRSPSLALTEWKSGEALDALISERITGANKFLDALTWRHIFAVPKPIRDVLAKETRIMTKENPVFMY